MKKYFNNPLFHFVFIGIAVYFLYIAFIPQNTETITITQQTINAIIQADESITLGKVTEERKQNLIENHIEEEVLLREAFKHDLYEKDFRVMLSSACNMALMVC